MLTARYGLDVTGQNLGNSDTQGYSRQVLQQQALRGYGTSVGNAILGIGVWTQKVTRVADEYIEKQLRESVSQDEYYGNLQSCYSNIQYMYNELTGNAISDAMDSFWDSMNDLSAHVEDIAIRKTAITDAQAMTQRFNRLSQQLVDYRKDVDNQVAESVNNINQLLNTVATLNKQITTSEFGGVSAREANDLRDQRGEAIKALYEYMDIATQEEENGSIIVSLHGRNLVYFDLVKEVSIDKNESPDGTLVNTPVFASDHYPLRPQSGKLAAQLEMRDEIIPSYQKDVNDLAANFIWEFNRIYSQTRGLETFDSITSLNGPKVSNVTLDKLDWNDQIMKPTFQIQNGNMEIVVQNRNTNLETTVNIEIDLDGRLNSAGEPDMILFDHDNPEATNSLIYRMQRALDEAVPGMFNVTIDRYNRVTIESNSSDYGFCFGQDTSGVLAALGINTFFTGFNAGSMGVNEMVSRDPKMMGAAYSFNKGDNDGIVAMLQMREAALVGLNGQTLDGHYQTTAGRLAAEAASTNSQKELSEDIFNSMFQQRESLSGVNTDEEVTKMLTYQRSFQAAARFISVVDSLYETLIQM